MSPKARKRTEDGLIWIGCLLAFTFAIVATREYGLGGIPRYALGGASAACLAGAILVALGQSMDPPGGAA